MPLAVFVYFMLHHSVLLLIVVVSRIRFKNLLYYITTDLASIPGCQISVIALLQVNSYLIGYFILHLFE